MRVSNKCFFETLESRLHNTLQLINDQFMDEIYYRYSFMDADVNCYSWVISVLKNCKKIAMCLQFMVLFVEIVNIFILVWFYRVETPFLWSNVEFNSICRLKKRKCKKLLMNSLSKADWLSEPHPLSEAANSLSGCKTIEEDKSEISALNAQPTCPRSTLSLLALSAPKLS